MRRRLYKERSRSHRFFSNSNIFPKEEYDKRLKEVRRAAESFGAKLVEDDYDHESWLKAVLGDENGPADGEGGERCKKCFYYRLLRAANFAKKNDSAFLTTLGVSPYKNDQMVNAAGKAAEKETGAEFIPLDVLGEKSALWKESLKVSKEMAMYRQKYCGCEFSLFDKNRKK